MAKSLSELKPKPIIEVPVEAPKAVAPPPTAPLPEPPIAAEIEPEPVVAPAPKPKKPAAAAVAPPAAVAPRPVIAPKAVKAATPVPAPPAVAPVPEPPAPLPTYGFSQADGHVLWSALRAEWEKDNYRPKDPTTGQLAPAPAGGGKTPEQVFSDFAAARGMTTDDLRTSAAAAGADLDEIQRIAQQNRSRTDSLSDLNRSMARGRYTTPEKARQAAVAETVVPETKEKDLYSLVATQSPTTEIFTSAPEDDVEVTRTTAGKAHAKAVFERIDPERLVRYKEGFQRYAQDSTLIFTEAAGDILKKHGVIFDVIGPDGKEHEVILHANNAKAAAEAMKSAGIDFGDTQMDQAAKVANEAMRRATARAVNEAAAAYTLGHFANPIRARIPFSQLAELARPGAFDPMKDDSPMFDRDTPIVDARARVERGEYIDAALQAAAPLTHIVGLAEIPGRATHWPVLVRQQSATETAFDWTDTPYAAFRGAMQPVVDALNEGDYAKAAANLTLGGFAKVEGGEIVARSPEEIYGDVLASIEQRQTSFEDVQQSGALTDYLKKINYGVDVARKAGMSPPDRYNLDYNGDGKIDASDREAGWREMEDDVTFGLQNVAAFGAAVATLDVFDALAAMRAGRLIRQAIRATEVKPNAIQTLSEAADALDAGRYEEAASLERKVEYRPSHSDEPKGPPVAAPEGNAPEIGRVSRMTEAVVAHEAKVQGKADEMFDMAMESALPDIPPVSSSPTGDVSRRFYLHGSVRTKGGQIVSTEDLRARYDFKHRYNVVKALEDAVAAGTDTYAARLVPRFRQSLDDLLVTLKSNGMPDLQAERLGKMWEKAIARGEDISMMTEPALEAHMKGDNLKAAKKASRDLGARLKAEHAVAKAEGRIAVERARRAVDQQVRVRSEALRRTVAHVQGDESAFGKWLYDKMPAVRNWFAGFRKPKNLTDLVESEALRLAASSDLPRQKLNAADVSDAIDDAETAILVRTREVEAAQIAKDEAAEKKAKKLLKAATTRRNKAVRSLAEAINGRGHVLSDAGIEHFLRMRAADGGVTAADEIMFTTILIDLRAEKMVEEGTAKTLEEVHERFSWRRSDTVGPDALLQGETPDFIEPERLSRGPRVVRSETGEMSVAALSKGTAAELNKMLLAFENATYIDPGSLSRARQLVAKAAGGRVSAAVYDNLREIVDDIVGDAAARLGDEVEFWERRWNVLRGQVTTGPTEPLSVLPPQKVPTDPVEMTRVVRDTPWFHGAVRGEVQLREYDPAKHAGTSAGSMFGPGIYLAENPEIAISYATHTGRPVGTAPGKAALKTVMVSPERLLDIRLSAFDAYGERVEGDAWADGDYTYGYWIVDQLLARGVPEEVAAEFSPAREPADVGSILNELRILPAVDFDAVAGTLKEKRPDISDADVRWLIAANAIRRSPNLRVSEDALREYFRPGRMVPGYAGLDEVVEYLGNGRVRVKGADGAIREHMTYPDHRDISRYIAREYGDVAGSLPSNIPILPSEIVDHLDGLFHVGRKDGNVLVLFDPNGKIGGRSIINVESRVLPERVIYQTDDLAAAKAYVQFEADGKALVTLMKKADASSFIHETAHVFRRTLDDTDNATVLRWTKASGLDVELQNGLFIGPDAVKAEEMFARAFERFALEGKTTAKGLRRLFTNLRDVMLRIYRGGKALDVEISPEIEILFNRMISPKSVATEVAPTIHTPTASTSAAKWLADRSNGLLKAEDILPTLEAGGTVRLPFRVFGKDEINLDDFLRLQMQIDEIAASPTPEFKAPFKEAREAVVEETLTGAIQSATSGPAESGLDGLKQYIPKIMFGIPFGADALRDERLFAPRFRELAHSAERLLNQRIGDMNVFLREAKIEDKFQSIIRYMTGERQAFRVGGRQPLSAGHDAVKETGDMIDAANDALKGQVVQVSEAIDPSFVPKAGVAYYVDASGNVVETSASAATIDRMVVSLAELARRITDQPDAALRSRAVDEVLTPNKGAQNTVRAVVSALMTNGATDEAANTIFRHLGMALLNNGVMEGKSVASVIKGSTPQRMLAYVDAVYRLGGYEPVGGVMVKNSRTSAERLQDFIDVLDGGGFGPEGIHRALVVVNAFGAQRSIFTHISGLGASFSKEEVDAFHRFLNGDFRSAADYADGLRMFKQFGMNYDALEKAAGLIAEGGGRYIPANVQKRIGSALGRALDEASDGGESPAFLGAKWVLRLWQREVVRGTLIPKASKAWMDVMDTFFMTSVEAGFAAGAKAASRQAIQTLFISFQGHLMGRLTNLGPSRTDKIRSSLQNFADWMVSPTGTQTVNNVLKGADEIYRTADGRAYRYGDLLQLAIRRGTVSSFESSDLRESIHLARKTSELAGSGNVGAALNVVGRKVRNKGAEWLQANSELFESWAERERIGAMMTMIEAGATPDEAAKAVTRALFDYPGSLATAELSGTGTGLLLKTVQPFWAFQKNINHYLFNAVERPEVMYRLTKIRRAVQYGQEAVAQTIYSFYVDPYGFDVAEMAPETRASYYHLRFAYEESLGKMPHEMTDEERLTFAAAMMAGSPDNPMQVDDGQFFRLPGGTADSLAQGVSRLEGGVNIGTAYRPEPRRELLTDFQRKKIVTFSPAKRTGMIDGYIRSTRQQDLQWAVAFFEPAPFSGMSFFANTLALYAYPLSALLSEQSMSNAQSLRAIEYLVDPGRMPGMTQLASAMQVGPPQQVSRPLVEVLRLFGGDSLIYSTGEPVDVPSFDFDVAAGMSEDEAGKKKPVRFYAFDPTLNIMLQTTLYDVNQLCLKASSGGGAFDRNTQLDILRRALGVLGPATITETSQRAAAKRAMYELPPEVKPR